MIARQTLAALTVVAACGPRPPAAPSAPADRIAIVASEGGPRGARLVAIDEHGDRRFQLLTTHPAIVRESNPAISPDGKWMVFASTRDRPLDQTSLWIAPLGVERAPTRLTRDGIDSHPTWMHDGKAIVFASTRSGGFDLWRLALDNGRAGVLERLTDDPAHEVTPSVAADGTIVFAIVRAGGGDERGKPAVDSSIAERAPDGAIRMLTRGPADASPALSPDGMTIAFVRSVDHDDTPDVELWRMSRDASAPAQVVELPLTDEGGPVWSRDGRFLFATSVLRGANGRPLFSSVVHVDLTESPLRVRMLRDRAGAITRLTPAIATSPLDEPALRADPEYLPELARIMAAAIAKQTVEANP